MEIVLDLEDNLLCSVSLNMWANWIETGNHILSAKDAEARRVKFHAPDKEQRELIARLRNLSTKMLTKEGV